MASEASTADGRPGPSHAGTGHLESADNTRLPDRLPRVRSRPPNNRDAIQNVNNRITELTAVVAQMAAALNQANEVRVPGATQEHGTNIPRANGRREGPNQSRATAQDRRSGGIHNRRGSQSRNHESRGPRVSGQHCENTAPREVVASSGRASHAESRNHRDLRDHLNNQLRNQDLRDRLNDRRSRGDPNQGQGDLHNGGNLNPVNHQIHELQRQIEELRRRDVPRNTDTDLLEETESPFTEEIRMAIMPDRLKLPDTKYDGTSDPVDHLETYRSWMELNSATNAFKCRAFVITLTGVARRWFRTLRPGTISSFRQLSESFISQFAVHKVHRKPTRHLYTITQRENESTECYLIRFVKEEMNVQDRSDAAASGALMAGLRNSTVLKYLVSVGKPDTVSYPELIDEIRRHINAEKASNLEASKLSQDVLLGGGKRKLNSQVETSKQDGDDNGKNSKYEKSETQNSHSDDDSDDGGRLRQT